MKKLCLKAIITMVLVVLPLSFAISEVRATPTTVSIEPNRRVVAAGVTYFSLQIYVTDVTDLWAFEIKVGPTIPPEIMELVGVPNPGDWIDDSGKLYMFLAAEQTSGGVIPPIGCNILWPVGGLSGSGELAVLTYELKNSTAYGVYDLNISSVTMWDSARNPMTVDVENAQIVVTIAGDVNGDFIVDIYDAIKLASAYGSSPGMSNWDTNADLNGDGIIDIYDAIKLATNFGNSVP